MSDESPEDMAETRENLAAILASASYRLAEDDAAFIKSSEMRPLRMAMEVLKPELAMQKAGIDSTIVLFGGTRIIERPEAEKRVKVAENRLARNPDDSRLERELARARSILEKSHFYDEARKFAHLVSVHCQQDGCKFVIVTGGGPGIMEAGNRGAREAGAASMGLNISIPMEQVPNSYITPELCFEFRYFAMRKLHFLMRAKAMVAFPGGFGTLDELFETLTLIQTKVVTPLPVILFGEHYWKKLIDFEFLVSEGTINASNLDLFTYADTAEEAWTYIQDFYALDK